MGEDASSMEEVVVRGDMRRSRGGVCEGQIMGQRRNVTEAEALFLK